MNDVITVHDESQVYLCRTLAVMMETCNKNYKSEPISVIVGTVGTIVGTFLKEA